jgi:hypothetical protein
MKRFLVYLILAAATTVGGWLGFRRVVAYYGESDLAILGVLLLQRFHLAPIDLDPAGQKRATMMATDVHDEKPIVLDKKYAPFEEIGARLGDRAKGNQIFRTRGVVVADLNGDGRLDLFFPQAGQTVGFTTENKMLTQKPLPQKPCALYLNQGNDEKGDPIFVAIEDLEAKGNDKHVREELLVENKYRPRVAVTDDEYRVGRIATGAVAADFDGDGDLDLWVTSDLAGLPFTHEETALRGYPAQRNIGRDQKKRAITIRLPQFLRRPLVDGRDVVVRYACDDGDTQCKGEPEGRDTLFLNMGDADGDGIPEWKDVSNEVGIGGERWSSMSAAVADVDLDGDLDVFVTDYQDPDFYGFGMRRFGGNQNALWLNRLSETGKLGFENVAVEWGVSGLHDKHGLPASMWFPSSNKEEYIGDQVVEGKPAGEKADHSWSAIFTDVNDDGYPDLIVSTDEGNRLRVYTNNGGKGFVRDARYDAGAFDGCWMGAAAGDLDGDGRDEVFVPNCGGQSMSAGNMALLNKEAEDESIFALAPINYARGSARMTHVLLSPSAKGTLEDITDLVTVNHSPYIPPDLTRKANFAPSALHLWNQHNYEHGLAGYEFGFSTAFFDVENDGDLDVYFAGALGRGNDGFIGDWTSSPGRMLVNDTREPGKIVLTDRTLEYRLLDITDMEYDHNPPRRRSPGTNWHKRDYVYVGDRDSYSEAGVAASQQSLISDLFLLHEAANGIAVGDLNGDGYEDLVVTHYGGYNSLSPSAGNLKADVGGVILAIPAPNKVMKPPTNFEDGATFVYMNRGARAREGQPPPNHWVGVRLRDDGSKNRFGIGARLTLDGKQARTIRLGSAGSASSTDVIFGLGPDGAAGTLTIVWPGRDRTPQTVALGGARDRLICVERKSGLVPCDKHGSLNFFFRDFRDTFYGPISAKSR